MNNVSYVILACYPDKGMKSYGSKSLMLFNSKRLLDYQINVINNINKYNKNYEIIIISSFETAKLQKIFSDVRVINCDNTNPVHLACNKSIYPNLLFIDYGCVFNEKVLLNMDKDNSSSVLCMNGSKGVSNLEIGCIIDQQTSDLINIFFDLPENKFCNIFYVVEKDKNKILEKKIYQTTNLLYFEIINILINDNTNFKVRYTNNNNYIYFNNMRQKNAINKFIK